MICHWEVRHIVVDQYERRLRTVETWSFKSREEAETRRASIATESKWVKDRWLYNGGCGDYEQVTIEFVENIKRRLELAAIVRENVLGGSLPLETMEEIADALDDQYHPSPY